mgnify:CR=1 FL=1
MPPELKTANDESYARTVELIEAITPEQAILPGACGEWSACDVVAHFTGWHPEARARLQALADNTYERKRYDYDAYNAESVAARKHMSWADVVAEFKESHVELVAFAESLNEAIWDDKRARGWLTAVTSSHYPEHYEHLEKARTL